MKTAFVRFHDNSIRLTVTLSDTGKKMRYYKVSSMLNWCARNGYIPYLEEPDAQPAAEQDRKGGAE